MKATKQVRVSTITLRITEAEARRLSLILLWASNKIDEGSILRAFVQEVRATLLGAIEENK